MILLKRVLKKLCNQNLLLTIFYWGLLINIILLLFFIYFKSQLETSLVYTPDLSYNEYQWISFFISFTEFINIGLIINRVSQMKE